jgi:hypothetical protein
MLDAVVKAVLVFLILVVTISIISEYVCLKTIRLQENLITREQKIDAFLGDLKVSLMNKENFESYDFSKEVVCEAVKAPQIQEIVEDQGVELNENFSNIGPEVPQVPEVPRVAAPRRVLPPILPGFEPNYPAFAEVNFSA